MGWLKKLLGREKSHEEWLAEHPGKEARHSPPELVTEEEGQAMRERMEAELDTAREKRDQA